MTMRQHADGPDRPDTDDLGFRDDAEQRAYERAADGDARDAPATSSPERAAQPIEVAEDAVEAQAEPDRGEPGNAG